jgi:hypothetical protein
MIRQHGILATHMVPTAHLTALPPSVHIMMMKQHRIRIRRIVPTAQSQEMLATLKHSRCLHTCRMSPSEMEMTISPKMHVQKQMRAMQRIVPHRCTAYSTHTHTHYLIHLHRV